MVQFHQTPWIGSRLLAHRGRDILRALAAPTAVLVGLTAITLLLDFCFGCVVRIAQ